MRKSNPITRFYEVKPKSGWARIWITDDGCISIMSDWGNYGYWFGAPGCEFRVFLVGRDDDYLGNKFAGGKTEFDGEETVEAIRERILYLRREGRLSRDVARKEWTSLPTCFDTPDDFSCWVNETTMNDMYEYARYVRPHAVRHFLKHVWPLFVGQLKAELASEPAAQVASGS
jgi:hypothetical protein